MYISLAEDISFFSSVYSWGSCIDPVNRLVCVMDVCGLIKHALFFVKKLIGFVESATMKSNKRILLIDSLNVVEWDEWRKMDNENSVSLLKEQLEIVKDKDKLVDLDIDLIVHMISGALNDLSLYLADIETLSKSQIYKSISHLLKGFEKDVKKI